MFTARLRQVVFALIVAAMIAATAHAQEAASAAAFPLKDGDTWVMVGDSITAQKLHSNYIEAFCYARFPQWTFHFRNSGVGGDRIPRALERFDYDAAAWKPTIISVELGMNDASAGPNSTPDYIKGMKVLLDRIRAVGARPVLISASPVNGAPEERNAGRNVVLSQYATALGELAAQQQAPYADQFHALVNRWADNKPIENMHRFADSAREMTANPQTPKPELLKAWLTAWDQSGVAAQGGSLGGRDPIHPGPAGQLTMCAAILKALGAPTLVSHATLAADGKVIQSEQCRISQVKADADGLSFDRLDECLPMPIADEARAALVVLPSMADLSQWMLTVQNLPAGSYTVSIDGQAVGQVSAEQLAKGWNMSTLAKGPVAQQGRDILKLVSAKESLVAQWRTQSAVNAKAPTAELQAGLEALNQQILQADAQIRAAAQPKSHRFQITKARG